MRAHYLQHVSFEGLGSIEAWLKKAHYEISCTRLFASDALPAVTDIDLLIVMGGPMSVNDEADYPWLVKEKQFIQAVIDAKKPILGICLGAQLIANTLGSKVYPNPVKEIGWFPIDPVITENKSAFQFTDSTTVFHWHGETFDLPINSVQLAKSPGCQHQAFQIGSNVIGLQFHLETTPASAQAIIEHCRDELEAGVFIQSETEMLSVSDAQYTTINRLMGNILDYLTTT